MIAPEVHDLLRRAAGLDRVILASDFDGTLAPFHVDPMAVRPAPGAMETLRRAATLPGVTVALVSGRDLETLALLSDVDSTEPIVLIGSHGAQSSRPTAQEPDSPPPQLLDQTQAALLATIQTELEAICERYPGAWVEHKAAARALHTRPLDAEASESALAEAMAVADAHPEVHVLTGKRVVELPVLEASKGSALRLLAEQQQAEATVYFGDDVTDEKAFVALRPQQGDVTIKVGEGTTAATARVDSVEDVVGCLQAFVNARR